MANSPSTERPDLQDLVAYIEGRGSETLRAQVLQRLDEDEEYLEQMLELVPMLRDAGTLREAAEEPASDEPPAAQPPPGKVIGGPSRFRLPAIIVAVLAALLPIAAGVRLWQMPTARLLSRSLPSDQQLLEQEPLLKEATRGKSGDMDDERANPGDLFRTGAQLVDLEVALQQGDEAKVQKRLSDIQASFDDLYQGKGASGLSAKIPMPKVEAELDDAWQHLYLSKTEERYVTQGSCVRAAWLALQVKDSSFRNDFWVARRCEDAVGAEIWRDADEQLLVEMLESESIGVDDIDSKPAER